MAAASVDLERRLVALGVAPEQAKKDAASKSAAAIAETIAEAEPLPKDAAEKGLGVLLYTLATTYKSPKLGPRKEIAKLIAAGGIRNHLQVAAAVKYATTAANFSVEELKRESGYGLEITAAEIKAAVTRVLDEQKAVLEEEAWSAQGKLLIAINGILKFADGKKVKEEFDAQMTARVGPRGAERKKPAPAAAAAAANGTAKKPAPAAAADEKEKKLESKMEDLARGRMVEWAINTPEQMQRHLAATKGQVRTRFPPEPNGYLHLGHAKAAAFSFSLARKSNGWCVLRFDDTNPSAEKQEYIDNIIANVRWLGHEPDAIYFSSDYFDKLYQLAVELIKRDGAYVCHMKKEDMESERGRQMESPYRNRSVEENLRLFEDMRKGKFREGECTLRMKADMKHPMACMWDLVAYRIQYRPHPHVGDKWCIYPTYDYTHCIIDSLENITHSLCTLEFESRRESYFWLLDKLDLYKPTVWEYSRLNVEFGVMSKRIIKYLVEHKLVAGWDDPRLLTLNGLRRRGYTPAAINLLCEKVGVTRNDNMAQMDLLEHCVRSVLDDVVPRAFVVKDPVPVVLANYPADKSEVLRAPVHPKKPDGAMRELPFSRVIYIDREDFRKEDEKDFYRLAPNKTVHLRFGYDIHCTGFKEDASGRVTEIQATVDTSEDSLRNAKKHKGVIHWVAEKGAVPCELRLYDLLFTIKDPAAEKDWIKFMNPKSLVVTRGFGEPSIAAAKSEDKFQFERVGYFNTDYDSRPGALIFNLTCGLKDTKGKT